MTQPDANSSNSSRDVKTKTLLAVLQLVQVAILTPVVIDQLRGAEESVSVFSEMNMEPGGRLLIGLLQLLCVILLLIPGFSVYGAILTLGVMIGAIIGHLTQIGFEGALLVAFTKTLIVAACSVGVIYLRRRQVPLIRAMFE